MEAKLHKLKVTELKELLAKNHLVQTGKKDELIKRLLDNNVHVGDEEPEVDAESELVDPDLEDPPASAPAPVDGTTSTAPAKTTEISTADPAATADTPSTEATLTAEQQAMKARAERFGIPFNPNPSPKTSDRKSKSTPAAKSDTKPDTPATVPSKEEKPKKAGAIDAKPLGLSDEVLARRAAKFGLPEKKDAAAPAPAPAKAAAVELEQVPKVDVNPELAARLAAEEEKKRKRAEKFGTATTTSTNGTNGSAEPDAKKTKV